MARIVNPAGVPDNPVIEGNITATTAEADYDWNGAHRLKANSIEDAGIGSEVIVAGTTAIISASNFESNPNNITSQFDVSVSPVSAMAQINSSYNDGVENGYSYVDVTSSEGSSDVTLFAQGTTSGSINLTATTGVGAGTITLTGDVSTGVVDVSDSLTVNNFNIQQHIQNGRKSGIIFNDFHGGDQALSSSTGQSGAGASSLSVATWDPGILGVLGIATGTDTTGRFSQSYLRSDTFGAGFGYSMLAETYIKLPVLSDGTNSYAVQIGFGPQSSHNINEGQGTAAFLYEANTNAHVPSAQAYWQTLTVAGSENPTYSAPGKTYNSGLVQVPVTTNWTRLRIFINASATQVLFYVDDTLTATHTANITNNTRNMFYYSINKKAGNTSRQLHYDYFKFIYEFTTPR